MVSEAARAEGTTVKPLSSNSCSTSVRIASISGTMKSGRCFSIAAWSASGIEHGEDLGLVRHLHGRRIRITVARHHMAAIALGRDHELLAEFAGAEEEDSGCEHGRAFRLFHRLDEELAPTLHGASGGRGRVLTPSTQIVLCTWPRHLPTNRALYGEIIGSPAFLTQGHGSGFLP